MTNERRHIMKRYFPNKPMPRSFTNNQNQITRIENKVLKVTEFQRFRDEQAAKIIAVLQEQSSSYPRQRQLCKALLKLIVKNNIAIPAITTIQSYITQLWNNERSRVIKAYFRHTKKIQRESVLSLLDKTDENYRIVSIKKDMKEFNTSSISKELEKHEQLKSAFIIAKTVIPKLRLPTATIEYYAQLINYYNGVRLRQLHEDAVQLYLLCYSYSRFQIVNDNLLEVFKKRAKEYVSDAAEAAKKESSNFLDEIEKIRSKVHNLIMTIKNDRHETHIEKEKLYKCMPESEFVSTAQILMSNNLDKKYLYWKYIDGKEQSIALNLRPLFLALDITIINNNELEKVVLFMKKYLSSERKSPIPKFTADLVPDNEELYIFKSDRLIINRAEFLLYKQLAHHIETNKLTLKYSIQHKQVEDNFISLPKWKKFKTKILRSLCYPKLQSKNPKSFLDISERDSKEMYQKINSELDSGNNDHVILKTNKHGDTAWRLRSLEKSVDPNDSLFKHFQKRGISDVMRFVDAKTGYSNALNESILPRSTRTKFNAENTNAVIFSNAIRLGSRSMASVCDLNLNDLINAENNHVRMETVVHASHIVNTATEKLDIFKYYNIDGYRHCSLDGMKIGSRIKNIAARHSPKFLGMDTGVSSYNAIFNHLPITGRLIGSNKYEGNFTFEMLHHQNSQSFKLERASTDRHGMNSLNFALFDLTDIDFAPRIPKMHNETLWGFGKHEEYTDFIISPDKIIRKDYIIEDWDNMQRMLVSMLTGEAIPSVIVSKMSSGNYRSKTKLAFAHYNHIVRSNFILRCINDMRFRWAIECALNRGEAFNNLYRAIALLNGGKFRGQSEAD